jgi:hypothetical protein
MRAVEASARVLAQLANPLAKDVGVHRGPGVMAALQRFRSGRNLSVRKPARRESTDAEYRLTAVVGPSNPSGV